VTGAYGGADPGARSRPRWDVALSFAAAQRDYVGQVAAVLKARGVRCFYDADEQVRLWGTHLTEELPRIYAGESAAVVVFVSADYAAGDWTRLERRAAFSRTVAEAGVYVLPARFDDSELPGLLPDVVTVDLRCHTPGQFADLVAAKLSELATNPPQPPGEADARLTGGVRVSTAPAGWPLSEVTDPFALEVHRPVELEDTQLGLPALPAYVPREHDGELRRVVRAAAEGSSGIAVLVGGSSTGKTRACWEALRQLRGRPEPWRLWHPIDPSRPDAALRELPAIAPLTVVWLNEAQFYLDVEDGGLGERVAAGLRELLRDPARSPVLVLATLWPQFWDGLTARPAADDPHAQARELLAGRDITVPAAFTAVQLKRLRQATDARLVEAAAQAQDGQVVQFLAGAPELLARYRNAPPSAAALIHAAMDARRLGMRVGLPHAFLKAAALGYLTDLEWDQLAEEEDWLEQALAYTAKPCKGVSGPLTRIRPRPARSRATGLGSRNGGGQRADDRADAQRGPLYRLADYLDQHGRYHRKSQSPPAGFWAAAAGHAFPGDQVTLGDAAHARGLYRDAAQLHKNAAERGNLHAVFYLSNAPHYLRADVRPANWAIAHVPLDDPAAVADLLDTLREAGAAGQVTALLRRDPAASVSLDAPVAVAALLRSLWEAGAAGQITTLADRAAVHVSLDNPAAVADLLHGLRWAGAKGQITTLANRAAASVSLDDPRAVAALLHSLRAAGAAGQVTTLADRAAAHASLDNPAAVAALLDRLRADRRWAADAAGQITALLRRGPAAHVSLDDPRAVADLLRSLRWAGGEGQITALLRRDPAAHVSFDDPRAVADLLRRLRAVGAAGQVTALADRAAASIPLDNPGAMAALLRRLRWAGGEGQITALLRRDPAAHVSLDDPRAVAALLHSLQAAGAAGQVTALADRAAASVPLDNPGAVAALLHSLRAAGAQRQVTALADRAAASVPLDNPGAVAALLDSLRADRRWVAGAEEQVTALLRRDPAAHASLDDPVAVAALLDRLRAAGAAGQVTALADRAAASVPLDDPRAVAMVLDSLRRAGAAGQVTTLLDRDPAAHASLDYPGAVAVLLDSLRAAGAQRQVTALADRAALVSLDNPGAVARLLDSLRAAGAQRQVTALADRLPEAGMFELFRKQEGRQDRFRFGQEADGSPAEPWGWENLD
jgi:TIR domain